MAQPAPKRPADQPGPSDRGSARPNPDQLVLVPGDFASFERIYDRYSASAFGLAHRLCGCQDLAEDIVQQAFMDLWRSAARFDPARGTVGAWLLGIVRNRSIDACRRRATVRNRTTSAPELALNAAADEDPFADAAKHLDAAHMSALLDQLPAAQRQVLILAFGADLSHSEISELLSLPLGTVKSRIRIGLDKLRHRLQASAALYDHQAA